MGRDPVNGWQQVAAAGGGVFVSYHTSMGRGGTGQWWDVIRVGGDGKEIITDPRAHWTRHWRKAFDLSSAAGKTHHERKKAALADALKWASETYGVKEWARNRRGDYVPADVQARFPIPKPEASRG